MTLLYKNKQQNDLRRKDSSSVNEQEEYIINDKQNNRYK